MYVLFLSLQGLKGGGEEWISPSLLFFLFFVFVFVFVFVSFEG